MRSYPKQNVKSYSCKPGLEGYIKKSQKLPRRDIDIALKRVREFE